MLDLADLLVVNAHELADLTEQPDFEPLGDWTAVVEATRAAIDGDKGPACARRELVQGACS